MAISICGMEMNQDRKEMTLHGSIAFPVACYEDDMEIVKVPVHWHDEYEYIASVKGCVTVAAGTESFVLEEGDSIFINSEVLHSVKEVVDEVSVLRSLVILPKLIGGTKDSYLWHSLILPFEGSDGPEYILLNEKQDWQKEIVKYMMMAWDAISGEVYDYENEARYLISKAMHLLVDHMPFADKESKKSNELVLRVKQILTYIEQHYMEEIGNRDLMELAGCSESVLLRSFQQVVGTSPMQYVLNLRIEKAAELLLSTEKKACEIAASCGFNDVSYFTKTFRRKKGMTPIEYRKARP